MPNALSIAAADGQVATTTPPALFCNTLLLHFLTDSEIILALISGLLLSLSFIAFEILSPLTLGLLKEMGLPLFASLSFFLVCSETTLPFDAADIFSLVSSLITLPSIAALIFSFCSSDILKPE